jgi:hypothetical protein
VRKVFCDRCGKECRGKIGRLHLHVEHLTSRRKEIVAQDDFEPVDLCGPCTEEIRTAYGFRVMSYPGQDTAMAEGPPLRGIAEDMADLPHP